MSENRMIVLRGEKIDSLEAFYREFGEAVNGPGGYFGYHLTGFVDCLRGGYGVERPFTIRWEKYKLSQKALGHGEMVKIAQKLLSQKFYMEEGDEDHLAALNLLETAQKEEGRTAFETLIENIKIYPDIRLELIE